MSEAEKINLGAAIKAAAASAGGDGTGDKETAAALRCAADLIEGPGKGHVHVLLLASDDRDEGATSVGWVGDLALANLLAGEMLSVRDSRPPVFRAIMEALAGRPSQKEKES